MPALFLIKHALPAIDPSVPAREWLLGDEGQRQAQLLAKSLDPQPEIVVSSTEPKAVETSQRIAEAAQAFLLAPDPDLCEHDRSETGFLSKEAFRESVALFFRQPHQLVFGSETADAAHARFATAVERHCADHRHAHIAIVCHGTVMSLWASRRTGCNPFALWNALQLPAWIAAQHPTFDTLTIFPRLAVDGPSQPWQPPPASSP